MENKSGIHEELIEWECKTGKKLFQKIGITKNATIVDFGGGYGEYTVVASKFLKNGKVFAVDIDKKSLNIVKNKILNYYLSNVELVQNSKDLEDNIADILLFYDVIHANYLETKLPKRFDMYYPEAVRIIKSNGILSIAPFHECDHLRDKWGGKPKKYTKEKIEEIENYGFKYISEISGAVHFELSQSSYQWKKYNNNMQFDDIEQGTIWNFIKL